MSMAKCKDCDRVFDTDEDPDCFIEVGNMRRMNWTEIVCEPCRDKRQVESDRYDYDEQRGRDRDRDRL